MQFKVTFAKPGDLEVLVEHRLSMWRDIWPELGAKIHTRAAPTRGQPAAGASLPPVI